MTVRRSLLVVAGTVTALLAGTQATTALAVPQGSTAATWSVNTNPSAPATGYTYSVSCPTSSFCAAVGYYTREVNGGQYGEAWLRLADGTWHTNTVNNNDRGALTSVSCVSATFCLATTLNDTGIALGYRFDGKTWTPTSKIPSNRDDRINSVSCVSPTWCLAAGTRGFGPNHDDPNPSSARVWRYNGTRWDVGSAPGISGSAATAINGVTCRSTSFCLTAGAWAYQSPSHPWVGHFNGTKWTTSGPAVPAGQDEAVLNSISCPSTSECTTVGQASSSPLAATLSGGKWTTATLPAGADGNRQQSLNSVSCWADGSCTAVGDQGQPTELGGSTYAVTRSGSTWTLDSTPAISDTDIATARSVSCTSSGACLSGGALIPAVYVEHEYLMSK